MSVARRSPAPVAIAPSVEGAGGMVLAIGVKYVGEVCYADVWRLGAADE